MARSPRTDADHEVQHVMNQGARRRNIFGDDADRIRFLAITERALSRYGSQLYAYVLMGNHYHLALRCPERNVSELMQYVGGQYAQYFNRRNGYDGPLFRGRFHNVPVVSDGQLLALVRYLHRNPIELGVGLLADYRWSSHGAYIGQRPVPEWLETELVLDLVGRNTAQLISMIEGPEAAAA